MKSSSPQRILSPVRTSPQPTHNMEHFQNKTDQSPSFKISASPQFLNSPYPFNATDGNSSHSTNVNSQEKSDSNYFTQQQSQSRNFITQPFYTSQSYKQESQSFKQAPFLRLQTDLGKALVVDAILARQIGELPSIIPTLGGVLFPQNLANSQNNGFELAKNSQIDFMNNHTAQYSLSQQTAQNQQNQLVKTGNIVHDQQNQLVKEQNSVYNQQNNLNEATKQDSQHHRNNIHLLSLLTSDPLLYSNNLLQVQYPNIKDNLIHTTKQDLKENFNQNNNFIERQSHINMKQNDMNQNLFTPQYTETQRLLLSPRRKRQQSPKKSSTSPNISQLSHSKQQLHFQRSTSPIDEKRNSPQQQKISHSPIRQQEAQQELEQSFVNESLPLSPQNIPNSVYYNQAHISRPEFRPQDGIPDIPDVNEKQNKGQIIVIPPAQSQSHNQTYSNNKSQSHNQTYPYNKPQPHNQTYPYNNPQSHNQTNVSFDDNTVMHLTLKMKKNPQTQSPIPGSQQYSGFSISQNHPNFNNQTFSVIQQQQDLPINSPSPPPIQQLSPSNGENPKSFSPSRIKYYPAPTKIELDLKQRKEYQRDQLKQNQFEQDLENERIRIAASGGDFEYYYKTHQSDILNPIPNPLQQSPVREIAAFSSAASSVQPYKQRQQHEKTIPTNVSIRTVSSPQSVKQRQLKSPIKISSPTFQLSQKKQNEQENPDHPPQAPQLSKGNSNK